MQVLGSRESRLRTRSVSPVDSAHALHVSLFLRAYQKGLERGSFRGPQARAARLARKRFARDKARAIAKRIRRGKRVPLPTSLLVSQYRKSPLLDGLLPDRKTLWIPIAKRKGRDVVHAVELKNFSLIDEPRQTLKSYLEMARLEGFAVTGRLDFADRYCLDIAAYLVLAEFWPDMASVFRGGRMDIPIQKVIESVGLRRPLGMRLVTDDPTDVWSFPLHRRRPSGSSRSLARELEPQKIEHVSDEFCDAVDVWLDEAGGVGLTAEGRARFSSLIGELLDNAERHSAPPSKDGSRSVAAFMARRAEDGGAIYRCHMAFLSVGASIADSLKYAPDNVLAYLKRYCAKHTSKRQSADTLATLVALQDGITRDARAVTANEGGFGFQHVLDFVSALGATNVQGRAPRMTIVSGRSCVQLRDPYVLGRRSDTESARVLWCNPANSEQFAPDPDYVFDLDERFGGTIIGISFVLDSEYIRASLDDED